MAADRIKVLFVSHGIHFTMGTQNNIADLIKYPDREKFSFSFLTLSPGVLSQKLRGYRCNCYYTPLPAIKPKYYKYIPGTFKYIRTLIKKEGFAKVHTDYEAGMFLCGLAKIGTPCRMVWHVRLTEKYEKKSIHKRNTEGFIDIFKSSKRRFPDSTASSGNHEVIFYRTDCDKFKSAADRNILKHIIGLQ